MNRLTNRAGAWPRSAALVRAARLATVLLSLTWADVPRAQPPDSISAPPPDSLAMLPAETAPGDLMTLQTLLRRDYSDRAMLQFVPDTTSSVTVGAAWQSLAERLERAGFHNFAVYPIDSTGFAVVCPVEHIKDNGARKKPEWGWELSSGGFWSSVKSVLFPRTERYRMMMLIVPNAPTAADSTLPDAAYADLLATGSLPQPPPTPASRVIAGRQCELRVYEFYRKNENAPPEFVKTAATDARGHAKRSQLWTKDELR